MATIRLTSGNDTFFLGGTTEATLVRGLQGNDFLLSGSDGFAFNARNDTLQGGAGDDILYGRSRDDLEGSQGNDFLFVEGDATTAFGGVGNDTIAVGDLGLVQDSAALLGGGGNDLFLFTSDFASVARVAGNAGVDTFDVTAAEDNAFFLIIDNFDLATETVDVQKVREWTLIDTFEGFRLSNTVNGSTIDFYQGPNEEAPLEIGAWLV